MRAILTTVLLGILAAAVLLPLGTRLVSAQSPAGPQGGTGPQQQGAPRGSSYRPSDPYGK